MKRAISLIVCIVSILCLTACGGGSGTPGGNGNMPETPETPQNESSAEAEPLSADDFVAFFGDGSGDKDMLAELDGLGESGASFVYFDPAQDESREGVIRTARGISLGDSKEKVTALYGDKESGVFSEDYDINYTILTDNSDLADQMRSECVTFVRYYYEEDYLISFYFDDNDETSWIVFTIDK